MNYCRYCGNPLSENGQNFCSKCGSSLAQAEQATYYSAPHAPDSALLYPMKWFKFLIYFALFAGAIVNFFTGLGCITGLTYSFQSGGEVTADIIYFYYGNALRISDIAYGVVLIALAVFDIFTRFQLSGFKKNAPNCIIACYGISLVSGIIYLAAVSVIIGANAFDASFIGSAIGSVIALTANAIYFNKRKLLFYK